MIGGVFSLFANFCVHPSMHSTNQPPTVAIQTIKLLQLLNFHKSSQPRLSDWWSIQNN